MQQFLLQEGQGGAGSMLLLVGIMVIFFFFMIRPQMKRQKEEQKFRDSLQKGDHVVTIGGISGKVMSIEENIVLLEIAKDVVIKISKSALLKDQAALASQQK